MAVAQYSFLQPNVRIRGQTGATRRCMTPVLAQISRKLANHGQAPCSVNQTPPLARQLLKGSSGNWCGPIADSFVHFQRTGKTMVLTTPHAEKRQATGSIWTPSLQRGDQMGPYRIVQSLGADDIGTRYGVTTGCENELPCTVAVVVLHPAVVDDRELQCAILDDIRRRFKVRSSNVVQTLGIRRDEFVYLVTEWVDGPHARKLRTYVEHCKNSSTVSPEVLWWPRIALKIITDCVRGLDAIHSSRDDDGAPLGLLHSNIAPDSIFIDRDGIAKLSGSLEASLRRRLMQIEGKRITCDEAAHPDQLADIQALGFTLLELLAERGGHPIGSQDNEAEPQSPLLPGLPSELTDLLLKATHRDPAKRFQSASELEIALERVARKHHLVATAGDVARFVRRYTEWELESKTMVRAPSSNPPPPRCEVEPEPATALEATIIEPSLVLAQPRVAARPPPVPPRQRTSSRPARPNPSQPPRRTVAVASSESEPDQQPLPGSATLEQTQLLALRTVRYLPQRSASLVLLTWLLAGTALLGVSSSAVALYQRHTQGGSEERPASPAAIHEARATQPVEILPDGAPPPISNSPVPATRNEPVVSLVRSPQSTTAVDVAKEHAALTNANAPLKAATAQIKVKRPNGNSLHASEISDPWSR